MRYIMMIAGVLAVLATQAQAENKQYRLERIEEKSVQDCSRWGQIWTVDVSNGVLTLGTNYSPRQFSESVKSDGTITKSFRDPTGQLFEFVGRGNGEYILSSSTHTCNYRFVPMEGAPPWNS